MTGQVRADSSAAPGEIYLVNHGWHTGLVLRTPDYTLSQWPESKAFRQFPYIELGWGDRDFYQAQNPSWWQTVRAALVPTPSVLFVYGHTHPPQKAYGTREIYMLPVDAQGRERMLLRIRDTYYRDDREQIQEVGQYAGGRGRFYRGRDPYKLPETCNVWLARVLRAAGYRIDHRRAMRAKILMRQVKRLPAAKKIEPVQ